MWPSMIWIGGMQGAGKSTIAQSLALTYDLPCQHIDAFGYDHLARMDDVEALGDELNRGAVYAADRWEHYCRVRLQLLLEDVTARGLGSVATIVEGPQLSPDMAEHVPKDAAVWLLASAERSSQVRRERAAQHKDPASLALVAKLADRERVVIERLRRALATTGRPFLEVEDDPDWSAVAARVEDVLAAALSRGPRLRAGDELRRQRRYENRALARQLVLWHDAVELGDLPWADFACECGRSGCRATWTGNPWQYAERAGHEPALHAH